MAEQNAAFVATIPVNYDRYLGPLFFRGFADEMAALLATLGVIDGSPIYLAIMEKQPDALPEIRASIAKNLASALGDRPLRTPLRAVFHSARRPAR
jgi:hypothetical protein